MRQHTEAELAVWHSWAANGMKVRKKTGKPFKSGQKVNTIKQVAAHDHTTQPAFSFVEDGSTVECFRCQLDLPPGSSAS